MALQYETTKEHTITVTGYEGTIRHLVIPDQVDGCPVKTIGKNAFSAREDLESVSIPKTVETLHHKIEGSGYPYRECVTRKGVDLLAYDRLFSQVVNDDYRTAIEIACDRLMYPVELENHLREQYEQYLEQNAEVILKVLIPENKVEEISYLCASCLIPEAAFADALPLASEEKMSQIAAILMEYQRSNFGKKKASTMSLDW